MFFDSDGGASRIRMTGTLGAAGSIAGVFTNDTYGGAGSFDGTATSSGLQLSITGEEPGGFCTFEGVMTASRYAPGSSGFAPASIAGRNVQVMDNTFGSSRVKFLSAGDRYEDYNSTGTTLEDSGLFLYTKTADNTGLLLMSDSSDDASRVTLNFTSTNGGTFRDADGGTGTFTFLP